MTLGGRKKSWSPVDTRRGMLRKATRLRSPQLGRRVGSVGNMETSESRDRVPK